MAKTSDAQKRASKKWGEKNPEKRKYVMYKSHAKTFFNTLIDNQEDIEVFENYLKGAKERIRDDVNG